jgi:uncharacterized protein with PIN domain
MVFFKKPHCFYCNEKIKKVKQSFKIQLNTSDGLHEIILCKACAEEFDKLAIELQEIINERL